MTTMALTPTETDAVEHYLALDLANDSPAVQSLFARAAGEAAWPAINLTGDGDAGALSANLTPAMSAWLNEQVDRSRRGALLAAEGAAAKIRLTGKVEGIVEPIEVDRLRRRRAQRRAQEARAFHEKHHGRIEKLTRVQEEYEAKRAMEGGRDALVPSKLAEYGIPVLITIPEFFMNYASFLKLSGVPAVGFGLSVAVAIGVAVSSFMTGTFWKAYHHYMHPDDEGQRATGLRRIGIAATLLTIAMAAVAYARYHMVLEQVQAATVLGMTPPNIAVQTAGLLAGNLLVFAIGAAITYLMHDENPDFADKAEAYGKLRGQVDGLKKRELNAKLDGIDKGYHQDVKKMRQRAALMGVQADYPVIDRMMDQIASKDAEVEAALRNYQRLLADALIARDPDFRFGGPDSDRFMGNAGETIGIAEFTAKPLHLYRSHQE